MDMKHRQKLGLCKLLRYNMRDDKLVSYTMRWSQPYPVETTIHELQETLEEFLLELSDFSESQQVLDRIRSK